MSEYGNITAQLRTGRGKGVARQLRQSGLIPAVMYGRGGDNLSLTIDPHLLSKATDPERVYNTLFRVTVEQEGDTQTVPCLIADVQRNAIRDDLIHVDFMRVDPAEDVVRKIPVRYHGRAAGVMVGGKLKTFCRTLRVSAKPGEIPVELAVDLSPLEAGQYLRIKDMSLPGATFVENPELPLAFIEMPKAKKDDDEDNDEGKKGKK